MLFVIFLIRATEDGFGRLSLESILLKGGVVRVVLTHGGHVEFGSIPFLKGADQLFLDGINRALALSEIHLAVLKLTKAISVDLLEILHFAEHDQFFFVDDLFSLLFKHVVLTKLLVPQANLALFFFTIEALLKHIDFTLVFVQGGGDVFYGSSLLLDLTTVLSDATFKALAFFTLLELNEGLLLVNGFTLLLDSLFVSRSSISCVLIVLLVIGSFSLSWLFLLLFFRAIALG